MMPSLAQRGRNSGAIRTPARSVVELAGHGHAGPGPFTLAANLRELFDGEDRAAARLTLSGSAA